MEKDQENFYLTASRRRGLRWTLWFVTFLFVVSFALNLFNALARKALEMTGDPLLQRPAMADVDQTKPLYQQTARVELGGRVFAVPIMFIDSRKPEDGTYEGDILLEVIWPEMRSLFQLRDRAEYEQVIKVERRRGGMLLESASVRPSLDEQTASRAHGSNKIERLPDSHGLEKYRRYLVRNKQLTFWSEFYFERDSSGRIITWIECSHGPSVRFPGCQQKFVENGIIYQISYNEARFLSQWRAQRERSIEFLRRFELEKTIEP